MSGGGLMILMRLRAMKSCGQHKQIIIILEDMCGRTLAIVADPDESSRLVRASRDPDGEHPIYDFLDRVLQAFQATPTRVTLDHVPATGLAGAVSLRHSDGEATITCYLADSLAFAQRAKVLDLCKRDVFSYGQPSPTVAPATDEHREVTRSLERIIPGLYCSAPPTDPLASE